jgi:arabinofuranan 3-O-arabinosyltransferase
MAIDGDPQTAWRVADRFDAVGEFIELTTEEPIDTLEVVQPAEGSTGAPANRWITAIDVTVDGGPPVRLDLDESSRPPGERPPTGPSTAGQALQLPARGTTIRLTIAATGAGPGSGDGLVATGLDAVGFAEIRTTLGPSVEVTRPPVDWVATTEPSARIDHVLTRLRVDPANRWRSDPEPRLVRDVAVFAGQESEVLATVRLAPQADDVLIAELLGLGGATASARLHGTPSAGGWAATDGDPQTAWITPFGRPIGPTLTVPTDAGTVHTIEVHQPAGDYSPITELTLGGSASEVVAPVPPGDADGWSRIDVEPLDVTGSMTVTISGADVRITRDRRSDEIVALPAALGEIRADGIVVAPLPTDVGVGCRELLTIDGAAVRFDLGTIAVRELFDGQPTVPVRPCDGTDPLVAADTSTGDTSAGGSAVRTIRLESRPGSHTGLDVDRVVLHDASSPGPAAQRVDVELLEQNRTSRTARVGPCPDGCWVVLGEGHNDGWLAEADGENLGAGQLVDGGFNGWRLDPSDEARTVTFRWTPQRTVTIGLWLSALAVVGCIALVVADRRHRPLAGQRAPRLIGLAREHTQGRRRWAGACIAAGAGLLLAGAGWAVLALAIGLVAAALGRPRLLAAAAVAIWAGCGAIVLWRVVRYRPFPNAGWPGTFEDLHRPGMLVLALLAGSLASNGAGRSPETPRHAVTKEPSAAGGQ